MLCRDHFEDSQDLNDEALKPDLSSMCYVVKVNKEVAYTLFIHS